MQCKLEQQACLSSKQLAVKCEGPCPCPTEQTTTSTTDGKSGNQGGWPYLARPRDLQIGKEQLVITGKGVGACGVWGPGNIEQDTGALSLFSSQGLGEVGEESG